MHKYHKYVNIYMCVCVQCMYNHASHMHIGKLPSMIPGAGFMLKQSYYWTSWILGCQNQSDNRTQQMGQHGSTVWPPKSSKLLVIV